MFAEYLDTPIPSPETKLWRYMDLTKLLAILSTGTLRFTNVIVFEDPYEGHVPIPSIKHIKDRMVYKWPTDEKNTLLALKQRRLYKKLAKTLYGYCFVNCWHRNDDQSAAMWKLYLSSNEGVAVQTTFQRLKDCFDATRLFIGIGEVEYVDFKKMEKDRAFLVPKTILMKRKSFAHEQEIRAFFVDDKKQKHGKHFLAGHDVKIDIQTLIEKIWVAPTCPTWIKPIIESVVEKYNLPKDLVEQSDLYKGPIR
jgi:hypothetical protein